MNAARLAPLLLCTLAWIARAQDARTPPAPSALAALPTHPSCKLAAPAANSDVRGAVRLQVRAPRDTFVDVWFYLAGAAPLIGEREPLAFTRSWTTEAQADGPVVVELACQTRDGAFVRAAAPSKLWVSNKWGSLIGSNENVTLSKEHIDLLKNELKVRWVRGGPEWGFHASEADFQRDVANRAAGNTWPGLVRFRDEVAYAHANGVRVLALALASPAWAHGAPRTDGGNPWHQAVLPRYRQAFAEYAKQLCLEGADAVEILNEPNMRVEYAFGPDHPRHAHPDERVDDYVLLLRAVYDHIKADPRTAGCLVGIGAPASLGHERVADSEFIHATAWYHALFNARADDRKTPVSVRGKFDFAAVHPYGEANTGDGPTEWGYRWPRFLLVEGDAVYAHGMASVHRIRAELVAGGEASKKLWATEVGLATFGGQCQSKPCASDDTQAAWVRQYLRAWLTSEPTGYHAPLAERFYGDFTGPIFFYQWRDRSDGKAPPTDKEGFFGLLRRDGKPKKAFSVLAAEAQKPR